MLTETSVWPLNVRPIDSPTVELLVPTLIVLAYHRPAEPDSQIDDIKDALRRADLAGCGTAFKIDDFVYP